MQATKIDLLIHCKWIIPVVPREPDTGELQRWLSDAERIVGIYPRGGGGQAL